MHQWARRQGRMADDPPFLTVGTEVSAKYKGAFCEAKVRKVVRSVKCKVTFKHGLGTIIVTDDQIRGDTLRAGANCEVKHPDKKEFTEAVINKIQDCSQYTVVFDDGDITTLRRTALCLKSGRHFAESETLDQLPLTHPEHFGNPVIGGRKGRRSRQAQEDTSDEEDPPKKGKKKEEKEADIGKVVCVELGDKKKQKDNWFPGLVVAPTAQDTVRIRVKDEYLVRSFKDGRYFTVPKKEATEFTREIGNKVDNHTLKAAVEKALQYLDRDELPPHWDRDLLFGLDESSGNSDSDGALDSDSSDDEPREEKDHFVAQLYKFMDDRGTPINRGPTIGSKDVDLYKLFKVVHKLGGYNRVTNHNQWKTISQKLGFGQGNSSITNLVKQSYKKFLHSFEDFYRKLGCTMVNHPRGHRSRHRTGRSLIRDRDRATPTNIAKEKEKKEEKTAPSSEKPSTSETAEKEVVVPEKKEEEKSEKKEEEKKEEVKSRESTKKSKAREDKTDPTSKQKGKDATDGTHTEAEEKDNRSRNKKDSKATETKVPRLFEDLEKEETDTAPEELPEHEPSEEIKPRELKSKGRDSKSKEKVKTSSEKSKSKEDKVKVPEEDKNEDSKKKVEKKPVIEEEEKLTRAKTKEDSKSRKEAGVSRESPRETRTPVRDSSNRTPVRLRKEEDSATTATTAAAAAAVTTATATATATAVPASAAAAAAATTAAATAAAAAAANLKKRGRKRKETDEKAKAEESMGHLASHVTVCVGDKLKVYYGPTHESKVTYEAKVLDIEEDGSECMYLVHYTGWNTRYDEWIKRGRIADNLSWTPSRAKRQRQQQSQHKTSRPSHGKRGRPSTSGRGQDGLPNPPRSTTPSSVTSSSSRTKSPATRTTPRTGRSAGDGASPGHEFRRRTRRMSGHTDVSVASDTESEEFESEAEPESEMAQTRSRTTEQRRSASASANTSASSAATHSAPDKEEQSPVTATPTPKEEPVRRPAQTRKKASGGGKKKDSPSTAAAATATRIPIPAEDDEEKPVIEAVVTEQLQQSAEKRRSRRGKRSPAASSHSPPQRPKLAQELKTDTKTETSAGTESEEDIAQPKGRDFDLNQIRSELKGIEKAVKSPLDLTPPPPPPGDVADDEDEDDEDLKTAVKQEPAEKIEVKEESKINTKIMSVVPALFADIEDEDDEEEPKVKPKELMRDMPVTVSMSSGATTSLMEEEEDVYEFKEPEPFEFEVRKRESPDSKGLARRPAVTTTTRKLELPATAAELPPPALSANVSALTSLTSLAPTRSADTKSPRKRQIRTPPKDATTLEGGKKIRRAPQRKLVSELTKSIAELKEETSVSDSSPPQVQLSLPERITLPSYVPASSSKTSSIEQAYEKLCTVETSPTSTSLTLGVKPNLGVRTLGVTSPIPNLNIDENPVSPPILSLPDDDDDDDDDGARKSPELGPLRSIFSEAHDDGDDDDHEDRLVISESDDMVEPLFTYQQRDHEDIFPTLVTSTAVVTAAVCTDTGKAEDPPCLSPATHSTGIFRGFSSPVREPADIAVGVNVGSTLILSRGRSPLHQQQQKLQQQPLQQPHMLLEQQLPSKHSEQPQTLKFPPEQPQLPKLQQDQTHLPKQQERHLFPKHQQDYPQLSKQQQEQPHLPQHQPELPQLCKQQCELPLLSKQQQEQPQLPKQQQEQSQLLKQQQELPQLSKLQQERSQSPKHHHEQPQLKQQDPPQLMKQQQEPPQLLKQQQEPLQFLKQQQEVPQFLRQKQEPPQILKPHQEQPQLLKQQQERQFLEQQHEQPQMLKQQILQFPKLQDEQLQFPKQREEQLQLQKQLEEQLQLPKEQEEQLQLPKEQEEQLQLPKKQEEQLQLSKERDEQLQVSKHLEEQMQLPKQREEHLLLPKQLEEQLQLPKQLEEHLQLPKQLEQQLQLPKQLEEHLQLPKQLEQHLQLPTQLKEHLQLPKQLEEQLHLPKQQQEQLQLSKQLQLLRQQQEQPHLLKQQQEQPQLTKQQQEQSHLLKQQQEQLQLPKTHEQLQSLKLQEQPLLPNLLDEQLQLPKQYQEQMQVPKKQQEQLLLSKQRHQEHPEFPKQQEQYSKHSELMQLSKQQLEQPLLPKQQIDETHQLKQQPTQEKRQLTHQHRLPQQQRSQEVQQPVPAIQRVLGTSPVRSRSSRADSPAEIRHGEDVIKELLKQQDDEYEDDSINAAIRRALDHSIMEEEEDEDTTGDTELFCGKQVLASDANDPTSSSAAIPASISSQKSSPTSSASPRHSSGGTTPARKRVARVVLSSTFLDSEDSLADSSDDEGQRLIIDPMDDEGSSQPRSCSSPLSATELRLHISEADSEHRPSGTEDDADLEASVDPVDDELRTEDEETLEETSVVMSRVSPAPAPDDSSSASELVTAAPIVTEEETMEAEDLPSATPEEEQDEDVEDDLLEEPSGSRLHIDAEGAVKVSDRRETIAPVMTPVIVKVDLDDTTKMAEAEIISGGVVVLDASTSELSSAQTDNQTLRTTTTVVTATIVASSPSNLNPQSPTSNIVCEASTTSDASPILALAAVPLGEAEAAEIRQEPRSDDADSQLLGSLLCQETIPGSPAQAGEGCSEEPLPESKVLVLEMPFASVPASSCDATGSTVSLPVPMSVPLSIPVVTPATTAPAATASTVITSEELPTVAVTATSVPSAIEDLTAAATAGPAQLHLAIASPGVSKLGSSEAAPVMENTPPTTPDSTLSTMSGSPREEHGDMSPTMDNESSKSHRDSFEMDIDSCPEGTKVGHFSEDDSLLNVEVSNSCDSRLQGLKLVPKKSGLDLDKDNESSPKKRRRSHKRSESESNKRVRCSTGRSARPTGGTGSDSDDTSENSALGCTPMASSESTLSSKSPRPSKYNFYVELDPELDGSQRIALLQQKLQELRKTYMNVKAELACIDRRRKKLRRREREVEKATKQEVACS